MNINRVDHMINPRELPPSYSPLRVLLDAVMDSAPGRAIISGAVAEHPDERVALVVLHLECPLARDVAESLKRHPQSQSEEASAAVTVMWQSLGFPPLRVVCCAWNTAVDIAAHAAVNEADARSHCDYLRATTDDHLAVCIAPEGVLTNSFYRRSRLETV